MPHDKDISMSKWNEYVAEAKRLTDSDQRSKPAVVLMLSEQYVRESRDYFALFPQADLAFVTAVDILRMGYGLRIIGGESGRVVYTMACVAQGEQSVVSPYPLWYNKLVETPMTCLDSKGLYHADFLSAVGTYLDSMEHLRIDALTVVYQMMRLVNYFDCFRKRRASSRSNEGLVHTNHIYTVLPAQIALIRKRVLTSEDSRRITAKEIQEAIFDPRETLKRLHEYYWRP